MAGLGARDRSVWRLVCVCTVTTSMRHYPGGGGLTGLSVRLGSVISAFESDVVSVCVSVCL